jgi:uncharacterized protein involved in response to NO
MRAASVSIPVDSKMTTAVAHESQTTTRTGSQVFFLAAAIYGAVVVAAWTVWFLGLRAVPSPLPAQAWLLHALLFGLVPAVVAGVLLPALPPAASVRRLATGWPLAMLLALWLAGRVAVSIPLPLTPFGIAGLDLAFAVALTVIVAGDVVRGGDRQIHLALLVLVGLLAAQAIFHWEIDRFGRVELADRLGLGVVLIPIMLIGRGRDARRLCWPDRAVATIGSIALIAWIADALSLVPTWLTGGLFLVAGVVHLVAAPCRMQASSKSYGTLLFAADLCVAAGFLLTGLALVPGIAHAAEAGTRAWSMGAVGLASLALVSGLRPRTGIVTMLVSATGSLAAGLFIASALMPRHTMSLLPAGAVCWATAFLGVAMARASDLVSGAE